MGACALRVAAAAVLALLMVPPMYAGPIRDRLMERAAQRTGASGEEGATDLPSGVVVESEVAYGPNPAHRMDVYRQASAKGAPVLFMVHGGAWMYGDKAASKVVKNKVERWVPKGYIVVSANYRLWPQANPLEQANEVAKALAHAQSQATSWGGDPSRFVVMGHSAGAHLVSLLTADTAIATRQGAKPWLATVSLDSAAFDIVEIMESSPHHRFYDKVFGTDRELWRDASPTRRLSSAPIPMMIVCSSRRDDSCPQAKAFAQKATSLGGRVIMLPVDLTHADVNEQLGTGGGYTDAVESFMHSVGLR